MNQPTTPHEGSNSGTETVSRSVFLLRADLDRLIQHLRSEGFEVVGPAVEQEAIVYSEIQSAADLPAGWTDIQEPGRYRLIRRNDEAVFGYVIGPHSWKKYLFPPIEIVAAADRSETGWSFATPVPDGKRFAFLGVRACELAAISIQDRVFLGGPYIDPIYQKRRENALIIAVNCTQAASTCFCTSMNTGPRCRSGFDLALTETATGFVVETGSDAGNQLLQHLPVTEVSTEVLQQAESARQQAISQMTRSMDTDGIRDLLMNNLRHPHWDELRDRCLSCANCTMVCPTCFCSSVNEVSNLTGDHIDRERRWDSCFNIDFSRMNGNPTRNNVPSRYRQWMTHKLATWHDQFGTSGCVGCGRCITWCPVGIDLTEEVAAIRATPSAPDTPAAPAARAARDEEKPV